MSNLQKNKYGDIEDDKTKNTVNFEQKEEPISVQSYAALLAYYNLQPKKDKVLQTKNPEEEKTENYVNFEQKEEGESYPKKVTELKSKTKKITISAKSYAMLLAHYNPKPLSKVTKEDVSQIRDLDNIGEKNLENSLNPEQKDEDESNSKKVIASKSENEKITISIKWYALLLAHYNPKLIRKKKEDEQKKTKIETSRIEIKVIFYFLAHISVFE